MKPTNSRAYSSAYFLALSIALGAGLAVPSSGLSAAGLNAAKDAKQEAGCARCKKSQRMPRKKEAQLYKEMAKVAKATKEEVNKKHGNIQPKDLAPKAAAFARVFHTLTEMSPRGDIITLQDGSAWSVGEDYHAIAASWMPSNELNISPNLSVWYKLFGWGNGSPKYKYLITNNDKNQSVEANLSLGPFVHNVNTKRIRRIDKSRGEIYFTNGTLWKCEAKGAAGEIFNEWKVGDYVTTGTNDTWFSFWNQDIIINFSADNWIPAERLF